ncbi:hypothetical protein CRV00_08330 [Malaciobacter molluscorum]|uniref:TonB-dependent siderophore receptor n=1 Tax=Malaciobacter molluscorum TaxID=1032072 RepID=UPI00100BFB10|nr:TonB-dependent siderophore receptor [Malaciobacter molluscorum]RXJ94228.1 hypothetical protein CRV00_08330 [Malaciobacter molluscorum]
MSHKKIIMSLITSITLIPNIYAENIGTVDVIDTSDTITENSDTYTIKSTKSATKMNLDLLETPQSISITTSQKMKDFNLTTLEDVLNNSNGIYVEQAEQDRVQFTSRGFSITNIQIDGVSLPLSGNYLNGDMDMALFDRVEVTKGATGLTSAHGNPSATVNLIRKKPTKEFQGNVKLSAGSWNYKRFDLDVSSALNETGTIRGRIIAAKENNDSYLDRYESDSSVFSAIVEADLNDTLLLTTGFSYYKDDNDSSQMGGIPTVYSNGKATNYDISANPSPNWAYRDVKTFEAYAKIKKTFSNDWQLNTNYLYKRTKEDSNLLNLWGIPNINEIGYKTDLVQKTNSDVKEHSIDISYDGTYSLFGQEHSAVIGVNLARRTKDETAKRGFLGSLGTDINLDHWNGHTSDYSSAYKTKVLTDYTEKQAALYFATNYHILDNLSLLVGTRITNWKTEGINFGSEEETKDNGVFTPYAGLVYKINDNLSTYVSYTTTFEPQNYIDENKSLIDPAEGKSYEAGIKTSFLNGKLNTNISVFKTEQDNIAAYGGTLSDGRTYYTSNDGVKTKGFEIEANGSLTDNINMSIGYTKFTIKDDNDEDFNTYLPKELLKASITYNPSFIPALKVGAAFNYQESIKTQKSSYTIRQRAIKTIDLMANYQISKNLDLNINATNLTDEKYYGGLIKQTYANYATPRRIGASLVYKF